MDSSQQGSSILNPRQLLFLASELLHFEKYKAECKKNRTEEQYIKHGDTFFNKAILDYTEQEKEETKEVYKEIRITDEEYKEKIKQRRKKICITKK